MEEYVILKFDDNDKPAINDFFSSMFDYLF